MLLKKLTEKKLLQNQAYINGQWISTPTTYPIINPASGEVITEVSYCTDLECDMAINAASDALIFLKKTTGKERAVFLKRIAELMMHHQKDLATILTTEQGKPFAEAMGEIVYAAS